VVSAINSTANITTTANISGGNLIQNGTRVYKWTTSATPPADAVAGDDWYVPSSGKLYQYWYDGTSNVWVDQSQSNSFDSLAVSGNAVITGNVTGGNLITGGNVSAVAYTGTSISVTGNITGGNLNAAGMSLSGNVVSPLNVTGNIAGGNITTPGLISATGNITGGNVSATALTGTTVSVTGNITGANIIGNIYTNSIVNSGANLTGNIGSSTTYFNTVFAKATSAQYADLAEMYMADYPYKFGTVVVFGGTQEVTVSDISHDTAVAGVISRNPAHIMNAGLEAEHAVPVALTGRVQCQVQGPVRKGDVLVNIAPGVAGKLNPDLASWGCVIGKSLEDLSSSQVENIEIVVGRY
jgi:hypothetical protein